MKMYNQSGSHENSQMKKKNLARYYQRFTKDIQKREKLAFDNFV